MTRRVPMGLTIVTLAVALATPLAGQRPEVVGLRFDGARSFTKAELSAAITTAASRCSNVLYELVCWLGAGREPAYMEPGALESDALRLRVYYHERGFRNAVVHADTARAGNGVRVTFRIEEGRPTRVSALEVLDAPPDLSTRALPLRVDAPFDMVAYEAARDTLLARLRNGGYARAQVLLGHEISSDAPLQARVRYEVFPGAVARFGEIQVLGHSEVSPELVRRMLTFRAGGRYNRSAMLESQRNLYALQIFRHAEVRAELEEGPDTIVPITVQVAEGNMRRVRIGAGVSNVECGNVEGRWVDRNFRGDGRRLEVRGQVGNLFMDQCQELPLLATSYTPYHDLTGLVAIDFSQPWLFGPRNSLGTGVFAERRSVPEVFVRTAVGGHLSVGRTVGRTSSLTLAYRPEWTRLSAERDLFFCVNFIACTYEDTRLLREPHWLSPVALTFSADRTDATMTPSSGYIFRVDLEHAAGYTGSDFDYTRLIGEGSRYIGEAVGAVLATRLRGGIVWPHGGSTASAGVGVNPQKRFFAGGPHSVRGLDQYRLGPTVLGIDAVPWLAESDDPTTARVEGAGCDVTTLNDGSCDVSGLPRGLFQQRPVGGEVLLEGNVELRFPLPVRSGRFRGAAFLDVGQVWLTAADVSLRDLVATPGIGVRYYSPVGPVRLDAGFDTRGPQELNVLTTRVEPCLFTGTTDCQRINGPPRQTLRNTGDIVTLDRTLTFGTRLSEIETWSDAFRRVRLHFSIGQAF